MGEFVASLIGCAQSFDSVLSDIQRFSDDCESKGQEPDLKALKSLATRALASRLAERSRERIASRRDASGGTRARWENVLGNVVVHPRVLYPSNEVTSLATLVDIHAEALRRSVQVKAVGSGHAYSTCGSTTGLLVETHGLNRLAQAPGHGDALAGQLDPGNLRAGSLPLVREGDPPPWDPSDYRPTEHLALVEMEGGITVQDLAEGLEKMDLALVNMGGASFQTIAGYMSTSTHGSGIFLGPICDSVRSIVLVTTGEWRPARGQRARLVHATRGSGAPGVFVYRVEPFKGITDPAKYADPVVTLLQCDALFRTVACSFGATGVVYSLVIETMQFFYVRSEAELITWSQALAELRVAAPQTAANPAGVPPVLAGSRNVQYFWSPYPQRPYDDASTEHDAVRLRTDIVPRTDTTFRADVKEGLQGTESLWRVLFDLAVVDAYYDLARLQVVFEVTAAIMRVAPFLTPFLVNSALRAQATTGNRAGKWYEVYNLGTAENAGFASEYGFPLQENRRTKAKFGAYKGWPRKASQAGAFTVEPLARGVEAFRAAAAALRTDRLFVTSPLGVRFVAASDKHLSMMHGTLTGMVELDMAYGTFAYDDLLRTLGWAMMRQAGGRFHWGLNFDNQTAAGGLLHLMYPEGLGPWLKEMAKLNAKNTYTNEFLVRLGLTGGNFLAGQVAVQPASAP